MMADLTNLVLLVCASLGALVLGVLSAYGAVRLTFALMRPAGERRAPKTRTETAGNAI
ncbi:MAG TPA: hypothetical protein VMV57_02235 [Terracidiphilus sp.]|nr:hypothetical protein [Terracidiphilus sp.]